jgi:hypothetical protein
MNDTITNPPVTASWAANKKTWLIFGALVVGLVLVIAPFPWNRWRQVHSKEARESVEFKVASSLREALQKFRILEDGRLPGRMRDLELWLIASEELLVEEGKTPAWLRELKTAGFLLPPHLETQAPPHLLSESFHYYPEGASIAESKVARRDERLIIISAASLTAQGRPTPGRYALWLDRDEEIVGPTWIPETEAQDYLKIIGARHRP